MICDYPGCTGVHDNNRYRELCPRSLRLKRDKDTRYIYQLPVYMHRSDRKLLDNSAILVGRMRDLGHEPDDWVTGAYRKLDESWRRYRQDNPPRTRCKPVICMYPFRDGVYPVTALAIGHRRL
jgi:hypothetical protein